MLVDNGCKLRCGETKLAMRKLKGRPLEIMLTWQLTSPNTTGWYELLNLVNDRGCGETTLWRTTPLWSTHFNTVLEHAQSVTHQEPLLPREHRYKHWLGGKHRPAVQREPLVRGAVICCTLLLALTLIESSGFGQGCRTCVLMWVCYHVLFFLCVHLRSWWKPFVKRAKFCTDSKKLPS